MDIQPNVNEQTAPTKKKSAKKKAKSRRLQPRRVTLEQLGVVGRTVERWEANPAVGFPPPTFINNRKYDDPDEIEEFIALRKAARG